MTAVINSAGNLEVIAWHANLSTKQLVRQGTWVAGPVGTWFAYEYPAIAISSPLALNAGISGVFTALSMTPTARCISDGSGGGVFSAKSRLTVVAELAGPR